MAELQPLLPGRVVDLGEIVGFAATKQLAAAVDLPRGDIRIREASASTEPADHPVSDTEQSFALSGRPDPGASFQGAVDLSVQLTGGTILLVGWLYDPHDVITSLALVLGRKVVPLPSKLARYDRPDIAGAFGREALRCGFTAIIGTSIAKLPDACSLRITTAQGSSNIPVAVTSGLADFREFLVSLQRLFSAETQLSIFEQAVDAGVFEKLSSAQQQLLVTAWNAAAAGCATSISDGEIEARLQLDTAQQLASYGILVVGWRNCGRGEIERVEFVQVGEPRQCVSNQWTPNERLDVVEALRANKEAIGSDELGFAFVVPTRHDPDRAHYLIVQFGDARTQRVRLDIKPSPSDVIAVLRLGLLAFSQTGRHFVDMLDRHIGPAVKKIWQARSVPEQSAIIHDLGVQPADPEISVIVPIYGRFDFIEMQVAQFANDPEMRQCELLYVIDDPTIYDRARLTVGEVARMYDFPFRVLYQNGNRGFAGATNLGAKHARGAKLLLLNSDVFPCRPGWLSTMAAAYDALPAAGAVAPKLLFEDGSIQHAGIEFVRYPQWGGMWINDHPLKGQPDDRSSTAPVEFAAITAACMMVDAEMYSRLGGLSEDYIIGDFEDTDLCLRLREAGRRNWLVPEVTLYHLERQSQGATPDNMMWRTNLTLYNCWQHHRRWDETISCLNGEAERLAR